MINIKREMKLHDGRHAFILDEIKNIVQTGDRFLITTHVHPDGDSLASVLVFANLLDYFQKSCRIYLDDAIPQKYKFLPGIERVEVFEEPNSTFNDIDYLIVLDASQRDRIGRIGEKLPPSIKIVNMDHHPANQLYGDVNCIRPESSSAVEIVYDLYKRCGAPLTQDVVRLVYTGIVSDTGCFRFDNTDSQSLEISAEMVKAGVSPSEIAASLFYRNSAHTLQTLGWALTRITFFLDRRVIGMYLTHEEKQQFPEANLEGFVNYLLMVEGPVIQFFDNEISPGCHRVSLRSHVVDVNLVAQQFGGGGHASAAGCYIQGSRESVETQILDAIESHLDGKKVR